MVDRATVRETTALWLTAGLEKCGNGWGLRLGRCGEANRAFMCFHRQFEAAGPI